MTNDPRFAVTNAECPRLRASRFHLRLAATADESARQAPRLLLRAALQFLDPDISKLHSCTVPEKADVPLRIGDPARAFGPGEVAVRLQHLLVLDVVEV